MLLIAMFVFIIIFKGQGLNFAMSDEHKNREQKISVCFFLV